MKTARIDLRVDPKVKKELEKAAKIEGKSLGTFIVECAQAGAARTMVFQLKHQRGAK